MVRKLKREVCEVSRAQARTLEGSPMSPNAKAFIALVLGTGAAVLANGLVHSSWPDMGRFLCYLLAVTVASGFKIVLPGISGTMSVNLMVILISVIELLSLIHISEPT